MTEDVHDEKLIIGHEYDGIQELDNNLPQWWLYGFYFTIVFAVVYYLYYHLLGTGPSMEQEYLREMRDAGYRVPPTTEVTAREEYMLSMVFLLIGLFSYLISLVFKSDREFMQQVQAKK